MWFRSGVFLLLIALSYATGLADLNKLRLDRDNKILIQVNDTYGPKLATLIKSAFPVYVSNAIQLDPILLVENGEIHLIHSLAGVGVISLHLRDIKADMFQNTLRVVIDLKPIQMDGVYRSLTTNRVVSMAVERVTATGIIGFSIQKNGNLEATHFNLDLTMNPVVLDRVHNINGITKGFRNNLKYKLKTEIKEHFKKILPYISIDKLLQDNDKALLEYKQHTKVASDDANDLVDAVLVKINQILTNQGFDSYTIPGIEYDFNYTVAGIEVSGKISANNGVFTNPATIYRTDKFIFDALPGNRTRTAGSVGLKECKVHFAEFIGQLWDLVKKGEVKATILKSSVHVDATVYWNPAKKSVRLDDLQFNIDTFDDFDLEINGLDGLGPVISMVGKFLFSVFNGNIKKLIEKEAQKHLDPLIGQELVINI